MGRGGVENFAGWPTKIKALKVKPVPKLGWALIGVNIEEFGKVQKLLEYLPASATVKTSIQ